MEAHIHVQRQGDNEIILDYIERLKKYEDAELAKAFEREKRIGITGVHQQALYLMALRSVMKERFKDAPITIEDNFVIKIK